jgi:hypothetical protein
MGASMSGANGRSLLNAGYGILIAVAVMAILVILDLLSD